MFRFLMIAILVAAIFGFIVILDVAQKQGEFEKQFTEQCHKEGGVVVEEHNTGDLLCFPTDA